MLAVDQKIIIPAHYSYRTETLFAWVKAIHNSSSTISGLRLQLYLFETGIKVVDLLAWLLHCL